MTSAIIPLALILGGILAGQVLHALAAHSTPSPATPGGPAADVDGELVPDSAGTGSGPLGRGRRLVSAAIFRRG